MEVQRLTNGVNGSYWLITFTDDRNCWICNWKLLKAGYACLYSIQRRKVKSLLWKAPEGVQSVSSYLKHDESLAVRWACVNRSSGLNEFRDWTALFHLSLSLSAVIPSSLSDRTADPAHDGPPSQPIRERDIQCGRGLVKLIQTLGNSLKRCFISVEN